MFKKIAAVGLVFAASIVLFACGSTKSSGEDTSLSDIKKAGKLVVAVSPDYAPFEFQALVDGKNKVVGADISLAQKIADEIGVKLEVSSMSFDNVLGSLQAGKADIAISGLSYTKERAKTFDFSEPYYETKNAMLVLADKLGEYTDINDFKGKNIAVLKGSIEERLAKNQLTDSNVVSLTNMGSAVNELKAGKVDAVDLEGPVAEGFAVQNEDLAIAGAALKVEDGDSKAVAMPKGSKALKKLIDQVVKETTESGEYDNYLAEANKLTAVE